MLNKYRLFQRANGVFSWQDNDSAKQGSLRTKDRRTAEKLLHAKNEAYRLPTLNLTMARAYLSAHDAKMSTRTWMAVMREMGTHGIRTKQEGTEILRRWEAGCRSFECCTFTKRARPAKDVVESNVHG
jgi:hypothetical protein